MTDPNTNALLALNFAADALIEVRDAGGTDKGLVSVVCTALAYVQAGMILACGQATEADRVALQGQQMAKAKAMEAAQNYAPSWERPNRG